MDLGAGETISLPERYHVVRKRGRGGMGVVYEVRDRVRGHHVALKTIHQATPDALYRLKREFRALADLSHPNLVDLYDLVVRGDSGFFTMELIDGVDVVSFCRGAGGRTAVQAVADSLLADTLSPLHATQPRSADPLEPDDYADPHGSTAAGGQPTRGLHYDDRRLRAAMAQLVLGLQALHAAGKVHRDIKPSNVLVTADERVVVLDFGLVSEERPAGPESLNGALVGTVAYMSPEQAAQSDEVTSASDCYSVGVLLYELLTGELPHTGSLVEVLMQKQTEIPSPPSAVASEVPADLDELCRRLLAIDPASRPTTDELLAALGGTGMVGEVEHRSADLGAASSFTGRVHELSLLAEAAAAVDHGKPAVALVRGTSGIGKTALIEEFLSRLQSDGRRVTLLSGRCYEQEFVPFKAFDGLIDGLSRVWRRMPEAEAGALLPRAASSLVRLFPVLGRVPVVASAPDVRESPDPLEARTRAFAALREVLQRLGDRERVVLFLDDLQWADADTLTLLAEIMREPEPPRILLILSQRSEAAGGELAEVVDGMAGQLFHVDVGPLSQEEAGDLVRTLSAGVDPGLAARLAREAAGSPFLLGEIVRYLQSADGIDSSRLNIDTVVQQRIELLPDSARTLLEVAAVSGTPLEIRDAGAAAGASLEQTARDVRLLRLNHLLKHPGGTWDDRVEPYHDRIRASLLAVLPETRARELHRALALALEGSAPSAWLARHWAGAGEAAKAAAHARRAADEARAALDFDQAAELYRTVLDLADLSAESRRQVQTRLGDALSNAGRGAEAAEIFLEVAESSQAIEKLSLRRQAALHLLNAGFIERGLEVLTEVLAEIGERLPATPRRALLSFVWSYANLRIKGIRFKPRDESDILPRDLFRLDVFIAASLSLALVDTIRAATYQARGLRLALRIGEPRRVFRMLVFHTIFVSSQGSRGLRRASQLIGMAQRIAEETGEPFERAYVLTLRGFHDYFAGRFGAAIVKLDRAEAIYRDETTGTVAELNHARIFRLQCLLYQGRCGEMIERFEEHFRDARARGDHYVMAVLTRSANLRWLASDDVEAARRALRQSWWTPPEEGFHLQHWYEIRAHGEIDLYVGDAEAVDLQLERLRQLAQSKLPRVQIIRAGAAWLRARLALMVGDAPWDPAAEARALDGEGHRCYGVWAALVRAGIAQRDGSADAAGLYEQAGQQAIELDLPLPAAVCKRRRGELVGGDDGARLVAEADASMKELGVRNPERMAGVIAPVPRSTEPS